MEAVFDRGIYLPELSLWLDSRRKQDLSVISHAHSDHTARHRRPVLTPNTLLLLRDYLKNADPIALPYGETLDTPQYAITLHPAGHCLGSAQTLITAKATGHRLLYTGDLKTRPSPTNEPLRPVECDTLIIEATYGHPDYQFPPEAQTLATASQLLRTWLSRGERPVALGWRLGKAQELLHHLLTDGFDVIAEPGICQTVDAYREAGINFPGPVTTYNNHWPEGSVALFPPGPSLKSLARHRPLRTLELTGWALSATPPRRHRPADATLPFSDHADYNDLLAYIKTTNPRQVYTVNGHPHLAAHLCNIGYPAVHLDGKGPHGAPGGFQMPLMQV